MITEDHRTTKKFLNAHLELNKIILDDLEIFYKRF